MSFYEEKICSLCLDLLHRLDKTCSSKMFLLKLQWKWGKATLRVNIGRSQKKGGFWCAVNFLEEAEGIASENEYKRVCVSWQQSSIGGLRCSHGSNLQAGADSNAACSQPLDCVSKVLNPHPSSVFIPVCAFYLKVIAVSMQLQGTELSFELA